MRSGGTGPPDRGRQARATRFATGSTAETVIDHLEDSEDYRGFEAAIVAGLRCRDGGRELVLRLASLLWRLRRIIPIKTDLFQIPRELTHCFLRLGNLDGGAFERLGRYNAALWKQPARDGGGASEAALPAVHTSAAPGTK
jgi:hypothetical protein